MTGTFRPSVRTSPGAVKSTWMRSSLRSLSLSNGAWTQTSPLDQSAGLVEKTAWARPLTNVGTAGCGAGAGAGAATRAASAPGSPGGSGYDGRQGDRRHGAREKSCPQPCTTPKAPTIRANSGSYHVCAGTTQTVAHPAGQGDRWS